MQRQVQFALFAALLLLFSAATFAATTCPSYSEDDSLFDFPSITMMTSAVSGAGVKLLVSRVPIMSNAALMLFSHPVQTRSPSLFLDTIGDSGTTANADAGRMVYPAAASSGEMATNLFQNPRFKVVRAYHNATSGCPLVDVEVQFSYEDLERNSNVLKIDTSSQTTFVLNYWIAHVAPQARDSGMFWETASSKFFAHQVVVEKKTTASQLIYGVSTFVDDKHVPLIHMNLGTDNYMVEEVSVASTADDKANTQVMYYESVEGEGISHLMLQGAKSLSTSNPSVQGEVAVNANVCYRNSNNDAACSRRETVTYQKRYVFSYSESPKQSHPELKSKFMYSSDLTNFEAVDDGTALQTALLNKKDLYILQMTTFDQDKWEIDSMSLKLKVMDVNGKMEELALTYGIDIFFLTASQLPATTDASLLQSTKVYTLHKLSSQSGLLQRLVAKSQFVSMNIKLHLVPKRAFMGLGSDDKNEIVFHSVRLGNSPSVNPEHHDNGDMSQWMFIIYAVASLIGVCLLCTGFAAVVVRRPEEGVILGNTRRSQYSQI